MVCETYQKCFKSNSQSQQSLFPILGDGVDGGDAGGPLRPPVRHRTVQRGANHPGHALIVAVAIWEPSMHDVLDTITFVFFDPQFTNLTCFIVSSKLSPPLLGDKMNLTVGKQFPESSL